MGKSTTATMFKDAGCALWDADAAVHRLYAVGGAAVPLFAEVFPTSIIDGEVSRPALKEIIGSDPSALKKIEQIVHPLVAKDRAAFINDSSAEIIVLDIPLLFEGGGEKRVDAVVCVIVDDDTQRARVMERGTMTPEQFEAIKAKQMPAAEKAARADYVIRTDTIEEARAAVHSVIADIREKQQNA
jgi:dephospho-CoA kinase